MISCRDVNNLQMDGMELVAGAAGLDRIVSWTYLVQTKPYKDHMNPGNFALLVVDYKRFSMDEAYDAMVELNELGISGFAISVVEDREETPQRMKDKADELLNAFKKGFSQATGAWGDKLPSICQDTYDAVVKKFDDWKNGTEDTQVQG